MKMGMGVGLMVWAISAAVCAPVAAQSVVVGLRGGVASSTVAWSPSPLGDELEGLERREAFTGGLWIAVPVSGRVGLRGEVVMTGKGFVEATEEETTSLSADYLEVPISVTVALASDGAGVVPELFVGGWLARETGCEAAVQSDEVDVAFKCDELPEGPVLRHKVDFGFTGGAAVRVRLGRRLHGLLDARYSAGLRNIDRSPDIDNFDIRHRGVSLTVGLGVDLGG